MADKLNHHESASAITRMSSQAATQHLVRRRHPHRALLIPELVTAIFQQLKPKYLLAAICTCRTWACIGERVLFNQFGPPFEILTREPVARWTSYGPAIQMIKLPVPNYILTPHDVESALDALLQWNLPALKVVEIDTEALTGSNLAFLLALLSRVVTPAADARGSGPPTTVGIGDNRARSNLHMLSMVRIKWRASLEWIAELSLIAPLPDGEQLDIAAPRWGHASDARLYTFLRLLGQLPGVRHLLISPTLHGALLRSLPALPNGPITTPAFMSAHTGALAETAAAVVAAMAASSHGSRSSSSGATESGRWKLFPKLQRLEAQVYPHALPLLVSSSLARSITELRLNILPGGGHVIAPLAPLRNQLTVLCLCLTIDYRVDAADLDTLRRMARLEELSLVSLLTFEYRLADITMPGLTDEVFVDLVSAWKDLRVLELHCSKRLSATSLRAVAFACPRLHILRLDGARCDTTLLAQGLWQPGQPRLPPIFPELKSLCVKTAGAQKRFEPLPDLCRRSAHYLDTLRMLAPKLRKLAFWDGSGVDRRMLARFEGRPRQSQSRKRKDPDGWYY